MKHFFLISVIALLLTPLFATSQVQNDYKQQWKEVTQAENMGKFRTAWDIAKAIYKHAVEKNDKQQQIKALIYQLKYRKAIEENATVKNIHEVDSLIQKATQIPQALLQNLAANLYLEYIHHNRYKIYHRTTSTAEKNENISTWSLPHFYKKIDTLFLQSLKNEKTLKKIRVKDYTVLVDTGKYALQLRPTLYDVLTYNALQYFTSDESTLTEPAEHFIIDQPKAFAPAATFAKTTFSTIDSSSLAWHALQLYQNLLRFHLKNSNKAALIDVSLNRLQFVYNKSVLSNKDELYKKALRRIIKKYKTPIQSQAVYLLANRYYQKGIKYNAHKHSEHRLALKKALSICEEATDTLLNEGNVKCQKLQDRILSKKLSLNVETVNIPDKPFRALVTYKNTDEVWFRIVEIETKARRIFRNSIKLSELLEDKYERKWKQDFPLPKDYQQHSAEMKVEALPVGRYALIASSNADFDKNKSPISYITFSVSNLSYVQNKKDEFLVLNRETGQPVKKAKVRIWGRVYHSSVRKYEWEKGEKYKTDRFGYFHLEDEDQKFRYIIPEISERRDELFIPKAGSYITYKNKELSHKQKDDTSGYLFTDRSIYRPGQPLYFKGLLIQKNKDSDESEVVENQEVTIFLYDANNQTVDSLKLTTNRFGSFAGTFQLPKASKKGMMHLLVKEPRMSHSFSVEAYKRPTFDVSWIKKSHRFRLGDSAFVAGTVMGYNGAPESGATIKYQVTRKNYRWPFRMYRNYSRSSIFLPTHNEVITQGETKAGIKGTFKIPFKAIPDQQYPKGNRIFNYEVAVDVTNLSGESHHYQYQLPIGDQSLMLRVDMKEKIDVNKLDTLFIKSTDLRGKFIPTTVAISIYSLDNPNRFIRKRLWPRPDQYIMDKKDFLDYFPHDEYKAETNRKKWDRGSPVFVANNSTKPDEKIPFFLGNVRPGWYLIKAMAKSKDGGFVKDSQYVQIYNSNNKHIPFIHKILWTNTNNIQAQPGKKVSWYIGSSEKAYVLEETQSLNSTEEIDQTLLHHKVKKQEQKIAEKDHGGIIKNYVTVKYNRFFTEKVHIQVPWKNKKLKIHYKTFRNKILPGEKETWEVSITGDHQEKINAELLASMYDLSLDHFRPHHWNNFDKLYPKVNGWKTNWYSDENFRDNYSKDYYNPKKTSYPKFSIVYPKLKRFGYKFYSGFHTFGRGLNQVVITGYSKKKRSDVTGAVTRKSKDKISDVPLSNKAGLMQGKVSGLEENAEATEKAVSMPLRKDFRETAFFYPQLHTDAQGNISFSFTSPDALTRWKLMLLAHTKDMKFAFSQKEIVTQKPLMIQLNAPRFVRQGDKMTLSAKVSNLSKEQQAGQAFLSFKNTTTGEALSIIDKQSKQSFTVKPGATTKVSWEISIPKDYTGALTYIVKAVADNFSDGAKDILPVLSNKTEITTSLPLHFLGNGTHQIHWDALSKLNKKNSDIQPEQITLEYTGNPIWYVVQALPFMDYQKDKSANTIFRSIYANALSRYVALKIPDFKATMQYWLQSDTNALKSPLQKNQELKTILLQETPWVNNAQSETAQKAKIAHWYQQEDEQLKLKSAIRELKKLQLNNGGFSWFKGMPDSWLITQQIVTGLGHLKTLQSWPHIAFGEIRNMVQQAVPYLDNRMLERYQWLKKHYKLDSITIQPIDIQYLYMRSFFPDIPLKDKVTQGYYYFYKKAKKYRFQQNTYLKAMLALTFYRENDSTLAKSILASLKETMIKGNYGGLHWKKQPQYYHWYQAPIATQAIAIEAFSTLHADKDTINALKSWLLHQKQAQYWETGKATANAVYALLLNGTDRTKTKPVIKIQMGDSTYVFGKEKYGLQYRKIHIPKQAISSSMKDIRVSISGAANKQSTWGAAYFQYFANMNKVKKEGSELHIQRQISKETHTAEGQKLSPIDSDTRLKVGDKVQIRLIVKADRDMDFVHFKDIRATCMEPLQVRSGYQYQDGVGYYSAVNDAAVHFYFQHLPKGTYVFTYSVYITQKGNFTGGLSQIESLYAPEIRAHSEGMRLEVK